ncbi:Diphthamide biosynthesis protein 2 [Pseudocyphellaria aurata]|nr:Diphthamide biosynthesis protein 2 [Pseudocyphellaria aurata]
MSSIVEQPPVLSTPASHVLEDLPARFDEQRCPRSDDQIFRIYEIKRTVVEIRKGNWRRVALQFPDDMLPDAPRVFDALSKEVRQPDPSSSVPEGASRDILGNGTQRPVLSQSSEVKLYILADTSYGSCCVDELAAEHVDADAVVHYGRACLSPTARLPVIYIFTIQPLATETLLQAFQEAFSNREESVLLMADVPYSSHLPSIGAALKRLGYSNLFTTEIVHDPSSPLPNRTVPDDLCADAAKLKKWHLFHISTPPQALLLILSSRVSQIHVFPSMNTISNRPRMSTLASTESALRRRYALVTSVNTVSIFGILINTLSVKNYLHIVEHVKSRILDAGKKSYTFVVGKVNAAKIANFGEIGGWVVIGCWESSLIDNKDFWKPVLTPFELELALTKDGERIWTGEWKSDFQSILDQPPENTRAGGRNGLSSERESHDIEDGSETGESDVEPESSPPEFDLRTGRYVTDSRPMEYLRKPPEAVSPNAIEPTRSVKSLVKRFKGDLAVIGGAVSPGAKYLQSKRTWTGLGSDFEIKYDEVRMANSAPIEEGRKGIARAYEDQEGQAKR